MKRLLIVLSAMFVTLGMAWAVEEGIPVGPLRLSLWGQLNGTWDDNAKLVVPDGEIQSREVFNNPDAGDSDSSQTEEDFYYELTLGASLSRETDHFLGSLAFVYSERRYDTFDELDNESWAQEAELVFGNREIDQFTLGLREAYREVFDYETTAYPDDFTNPDTSKLFLSEDRTERVSRSLLDLATILTWQVTEKLGSDYSIGYGSIDYDTEVLFDWEDTKGQAEFDYRVTDKTALLLTGQYGQQDSDALDNNPDYYVLRGGFLTRSTDKLTFKGGVGAGRYDRFRKSEAALEQADVEEEITSEDGDAIDYVSFDVAGDWDLSQRTKLQLIGRNAVQPAAQYNDNVKLVTVASLGISHRILEKFKVALTGSYRLDDYEDPVEVDTDEFINVEDTILGAQLRLSYEPPKDWLMVYAEARYEDRDTTIPDEDYDQLLLTLGVRLKI